jgi:RNA polymerase sigma-70 factor (ECF subfamily)
MRALTDEQVMARYARGDLLAFKEIYARYERRLYNYLLRLCPDREIASDLLQDTFLRLHRERGRYRRGAPLRPWIFTIATNLWRDEYRKRVVREQALTREATDPASVLPGIIDLSEDPERQVQQAQLLSAIRTAVDSLPEGQREVVLLSRYADLSHEETARTLGVSVGAVKLRLFRALRHLGEKLSGWTEEH